MRIICCLDGTNTDLLHNMMTQFGIARDTSLALLYVMDTGPHSEMARKREMHQRPAFMSGRLQERMQQAERETTQDILHEGQAQMPNAQLLQRQGRPEREIVQCASEWHADLLVICSRSALEANPPQIGPKSVGHVARFVLDHAPCPVLLIRPHIGTMYLPPPPEA
jgi:nucleotide-binding universal stress UspA family protein